MKIISNSMDSHPFDMLSPEHKSEILKYYDIKTGEIKDCDVKIGTSVPIPSALHLSNLTSISYVLNPRSLTGFEGNTFDIVIGLYTRYNMFTRIASNLILDNRSNTSALTGLIDDLKSYTRDYRLFDSVSDKNRVKMFLTLGIGLTIEVNAKDKFINIKIGSELTNSIISDRTFIRYV